MNPQTALTLKDSRLTAQQLVSIVGMFLVLAVIIIGSLAKVQQNQKASVSALVNMRHSVQGKIIALDRENNTFILTYESSLDPDIAGVGLTTWRISLPPGTGLTKTAATGNVCFSSANLTDRSAAIVPGECQDLVNVGREVLVEYVVLKPETASMIARTVIVEVSH